jgi:site-specific DNA recombinase
MAKQRRAAVIYIRVSTQRQAQKGDSPQAQLAAAGAFAKLRGLRVAQSFTDGGRSGRTTKGRTGLEQAIAKARALKGVLIVRSLSRLGRSVIDLHTIALTLSKSGADLASVNEAIDTSSAAGRAFFGFLAVMAAFESDLISERTKEAIAFRKSIGKPILCGVQPFGSRVVRGRVEVDAPAERVLAIIRNLRKRGRSCNAIAAELNRRKIKTSDQMYGRKRPNLKKAKWWAGTVHRLLNRN